MNRSVNTRARATLVYGTLGWLLGVTALGGASALAAESDRLARGRAIVEDRDRGNCFSCHQVEGAELPGNSGPPLFQMKMRYPDREALRRQIADPRERNPDTVMPPYGAHGVLTEQELDLVVDYVLSL